MSWRRWLLYSRAHSCSLLPRLVLYRLKVDYCRQQRIDDSAFNSTPASKKVVLRKVRFINKQPLRVVSRLDSQMHYPCVIEERTLDDELVLSFEQSTSQRPHHGAEVLLYLLSRELKQHSYSIQNITYHNSTPLPFSTTTQDLVNPILHAQVI
jgi:hypothetical protein